MLEKEVSPTWRRIAAVHLEVLSQESLHSGQAEVGEARA